MNFREKSRQDKVIQFEQSKERKKMVKGTSIDDIPLGSTLH